MAIRDGCMAAFAFGGTATRTDHVCRSARLVKKHQPIHVKRGLVFFPCDPFRLYVFALLLAGAQGFF